MKEEGKDQQRRVFSPNFFEGINFERERRRVGDTTKEEEEEDAKLFSILEPTTAAFQLFLHRCLAGWLVGTRREKSGRRRIFWSLFSSAPTSRRAAKLKREKLSHKKRGKNGKGEHFYHRSTTSKDTVQVEKLNCKRQNLTSPITKRS